MQLLTSGLGTNDDPQPPATPLAVSPTTRPADGLKLRPAESESPRTPCVLATSMVDTLEVEDRVPNQPALHHTPTHLTSLQKGPPLCLLPTAHIAGRPPQSFRWIIKGKLISPPLRHSHHRRSGKMRSTHTHCLKPILSTVTRENGKPSCVQQWLTIAVHICGSGSPATPKCSLSLQKTLGIRTCVEASGPWVCCFAHSNDTETIPTPVY